MTHSITGFGIEYEARISKLRAQKLIGEGNDLPLMGWQRRLKTVPDKIYETLPHRLELQNISGIFVVASSDTLRKDWKEIFGEKFDI